MTVEDKFEPLFTSATWTIVANVNGRQFAKTREANKAHTGPFIKRWTRQLIRTRYDDLRALGVDADAEYAKWGGDPKDLEP